MTLTTSDIMRTKLETIEEMASVQQAAKKMKDKNVSSLIVVDVNGKSTGAEIGRGDIAVISPGRDPWVVGNDRCFMIDFAGVLRRGSSS